MEGGLKLNYGKKTSNTWVGFETAIKLPKRVFYVEPQQEEGSSRRSKCAPVGLRSTGTQRGQSCEEGLQTTLPEEKTG